MPSVFYSFRYWLQVSTLALVYFLVAQFGLSVASLPGDITPVWPSAGIALAALLLGGLPLSLGVFLGAFLVEVIMHPLELNTFLLGLGIATANTSEAILATLLIRHFSIADTGRNLLSYSNNVFVFVLVAALVPLLSATMGTATVTALEFAPWSLFLAIWLTWWKSAVVGIILMTPLMLAWQQRVLFARRGPLELSAFSGSFLLIGLFAFGYGYPIEYTFIPLLMWATFRFSQHLTFFLVACISLMAVVLTVQGIGPFVRTDQNTSLLLLQSFIGSAAISILFLSAVITERQETLHLLEQKVADRTAALTEANAEISSLNQQLQAENVRMGAELAVTRQLQNMVLPKPEELASIDELDIAGFMEPACEVGGDYYDVLRQGDSVKIGIGDVTGHGLASGVLMLMVQTAVRTLLANNVDDPRQFLTVLNRALYENLQRMQSDKNLTLSLLDYCKGQLKISGQHEEVLFIQSSGQVERLDTFDLGFMVGIEPDISNFITHREIQLQPGDGVVLYTDGITEARNPAGKMYGVERLCSVLSQHWQQSAAEIKAIVINDLRAYTAGRPLIDDVTLLVVKQKILLAAVA